MSPKASLLAMTIGALFFASLATLALWTKPAEAAFPGANGKIALTIADNKDPAHDNEIYTVNPDGSHLNKLTDNHVDEYEPAWSADGVRITFTANTSSDPDLYTPNVYVMNADGSGRTNLTPGPGGGSQPSWSSDGKKIAFTRSSADGTSDVYVMNADGSGKTNLTGSTFDGDAPAFSPDGAKIAFSGAQVSSSGTSGVWVMNADGSEKTSLTGGDKDRSPNWSPDGTKIAFTRGNPFYPDDGCTGVNVYTMNADGSGQKALTTDCTYDDYTGRNTNPAFSPDGKKITYGSTNYADPGYARPRVWMMNANGTGKRVSIADAGDPNWQPNTAPVIIPRRPAPDSTTTDRTPVVTAKAYDVQNNLSKTDTRLRLDGKAVATKNFSYDRTTDRLRYVPTGNLSFGVHEAKIIARDGSGLGKLVTWSFRVVR